MTDKMRIRPIPEVQYLRECFEYSSQGGSLVWNRRPLSHFQTERGMKVFNSKCAEKEAGCEERGYRKVRIGGQNYLVHQVVFALAHGRWADMIDHIDGNGLNNRLDNLREATPYMNQRNAALGRNSSSGLKCVSWHKGISKWVAYVGEGGALERLGSHQTLFEAAAVRKSAEIRHGFHANHGRSNS